MDAWDGADAGGGPNKRPQHHHHHHGIITAGDEELKDNDGVHDHDYGHDHDELLALHNIPLATSPTAAAAAFAPPAPAAPRPPLNLNYKGVTMAAAAAKGDLAQVVLLWGMATAEGVNIMLPDTEVRSVRASTPTIQSTPNEPPTHPHAQGNTPFHHAALADGPEVAAFLLQQTGSALPSAGPATAAAFMVPLVHLRNAEGETPLLLAAGAGHLTTLQFLLEQGSDVAAADAAIGQTAFHAAARQGKAWALHFLLHHAQRRLGPAGAQALLLQPDAEGHTCLDWAAAMGNLPALKLLLRRGLDPRRRDPRGRCSLHLAARAGRAQVCRYLIGRQGLNPAALLDAEGQAPIAHARRGDWAVRDALRRTVVAAPPAGDAVAETPMRLQPVRGGFLAVYALLSTLLWALPLFLPWYWAAPCAAAAALLLAAARRGAAVGSGKKNSSTHPNNSLLAQWARAPDAYPGFWLGTLAAFAATEPVLRQWPESVAWLAPGELLAALPTTTTTTTTAGVLATYAAMAATLLSWADLVLWRPDPGAVALDGAVLERTLAEVVVAAAAAPPQAHTCPTCLVRKPLRSKVGGRRMWLWLF